MTLDLSKPVQTRDGRPVRILCTDARRTKEPVIGLIQYLDGSELIGTWTIDGVYNYHRHDPSDSDLINIPPMKKKVMIEIAITLNNDGTYYPWCKRFGEPWGPNMINPVAATTIEMEYEEPQA